MITYRVVFHALKKTANKQGRAYDAGKVGT